MSNEEDRHTRLDSAIRHGRDYWLTRIRWFRNEAIANDSSSGSESREMGAATDMVNTMNEVVADFQSLVFENNTKYKE